MSSADPVAIVHAYRNLYRGLLHAVQYAKPARYIARDQLREAFRKEHPSTYDQKKIDKTVEFLHLAARYRGLEHQILKNLLFTNFTYRRNTRGLLRRARSPLQRELISSARVHYDMTLAMLNDSMGLCLR